MRNDPWPTLTFDELPAYAKALVPLHSWPKDASFRIPLCADGGATIFVMERGTRRLLDVSYVEAAWMEKFKEAPDGA